MKQILSCIVIIISLLLSVSLPMQAEDNRVDVKMNDSILKVYVYSIGYGETLNEAKLDAIQKILPELIEKTQQTPGSLQRYIRTNETEKGEGLDNIAGKTLIKNYWTLENGIYQYNIKLLLDTSDK